MSRILVGTASWTDPSLVKSGRFYPPHVKTPEARLRFYADHFSVVEVDSTYYALPTSRNSELWVTRTPVDFVFDIKVFRLLTQHPTDVVVLPRDVQDSLSASGKKRIYYADAPADVRDEIWRQFTLSLEPLRAARKLGALLFQFPRWFTYRRSSFDHLRESSRAASGLGDCRRAQTRIVVCG
jgi:uncharacterized protein YecE (DUF72 family)